MKSLGAAEADDRPQDQPGQRSEQQRHRRGRRDHHPSEGGVGADVELPPTGKAQLSLQLPADFVIILDPVTHTTQFLDVKGEPTHERPSGRTGNFYRGTGPKIGRASGEEGDQRRRGLPGRGERGLRYC